MKSKLIKLSKTPFVRNVIAVASGTAASQAISMAFAPVVTRLYGPEDFGVMGVFIASIGVITPIAALTYPIAIVLPKNDADAKGLIRLSLYISVMVAILVAIILALFKKQIIDLLQIEVIVKFVFLIPVGIIFSAILQVTQQWSIRTKQFKITAKVAILQALLINIAKVGFGLINPVAAVLVIISTVANALHSILLLIGLSRSKYKPKTELSETKTLKQLAKRYIDFPLYRAPQVFINSASQSMPVLLLSSFFGSAAAGFYSLGITVLSVPAILIGKSIGDVFYPRIAEAANNRENLTNLLEKATVALSLAGIIPFSLVIAFGPWLFGFCFGVEWVTAGEYARWQALWLYFAFLNRPSVAAIPVLGIQGLFLIYEIVSLSSRAAALALGFYFIKSDIYAVQFFSAVGAILNAILILFVLRKSKSFSMRRL